MGGKPIRREERVYGRRHQSETRAEAPRGIRVRACAQQHRADRPPHEMGQSNSGSAATARATKSSRATAPISGAASARARPRWRNSRNSTAAGSLVIAIRCPVTAMCSNAQRHGPPGSWRSGQVGERQMGLLACRHGIHGDAFGPGYPLQSPVAALPAISASIPIASSRWRSLRATLARKAATSAHRSGGRAKHNRRRGRCLEQTNTPPT